MTAGFAPLPAGDGQAQLCQGLQCKKKCSDDKAADRSIRVHFAGGYTVTEKSELWCAMRVLPGSGFAASAACQACYLR
jgi:hypothetical protein